MKDEDLRRGLAQALRDEERTRERHARYEALAEGRLSADERAALEALAAADPEAARTLDAYRPLGSEFETQVAESILAGNGARLATLPKRGRLVRKAPWIAAPIAVAAAIALWLRAGVHEAAVIPRYDLSIASDLAEERAGGAKAASSDVRLHPGAYFEAVAHPAEPAHAPVSARAVLLRDGHARPWTAPITASPDGAVRIAGPASSLFPDTNGTYEIAVAVALPASLPDEATLERCAEDPACAPHDYRLARARVTFVR